MEIPEGFEEIEAKVYRRGEELLVVLPGFVFGILLKPDAAAQEAEAEARVETRVERHAETEAEEEDFGLPPAGFEWTGEVRPPRMGEYFWSDIKGQVVKAIMDESGVNQFGQPTGGRKILRPVDAQPPRPRLHLVKDE